MNRDIFLGSEMKELEHALMFFESTGLARLGTHVAKLTEIDEAGDAWFILPRPTQAPEAFGEISVKLDFYKKSKAFFIRAAGAATLVTVSADLPEAPAFQPYRSAFWKKELIAVRVRIEEVALYGQAPSTPPNGASKGIGRAVYSWLFSFA